jgi:Hypothetical protein (DUF2513)
MKLDLDVVRAILIEVESTPANQPPGIIALEGIAEDITVEHIELLAEQGLIEAKSVRSGMGGRRIAAIHVVRTTWAGHDFLANAKNQSVWEKTKAFLLAKGGSASFEVVKTVLTQVAVQHFRISPA